MKAVAAVLTAAVLLLAGCTKAAEPPKPAVSSAPADNGIAALSAEEILARAKQALADAKSYHMAGTIVMDDEPMKVDFKISGDDVLGSMTVAGGRIEMLAVGGQKYLRADESLLAMVVGESATAKLGAKVLASKWLKPAPGDKSATAMFEGLAGGGILSPSGKLTKGKTTISNGRPVIELIESESDGALYIATTGQPLPLKMGGKGIDTVLFTEFGAAFPEIVAPAAGEIVELPAKGTKA
ncbi:hypothetical protein GCM10010168_27400 [Actinoplanes ianthinogenes]|uniref:Lipoprotein n=1 Tax=Actinoplanes ianthinogenes TaxID=122358 RepID=A0ABM7LKT9_9ACTN|nr:hypothetical protein [Actinoplanes ianthinogenes]BCJ39881.1 hypothetical protein Aiant_05380 [Actinoplanes ianthinogenes]GGR08763.1 hypothetical protein GCM10010168_27400 [Actinoplanes ianthinogenes]